MYFYHISISPRIEKFNNKEYTMLFTNKWLDRKSNLLHDKLKKEIILVISIVIDDIENCKYINKQISEKILQFSTLWENCREDLIWLINNYSIYMTLSYYVTIHPLKRMNIQQKDVIKKILIYLESQNPTNIKEAIKEKYEHIEAVVDKLNLIRKSDTQNNIMDKLKKLIIQLESDFLSLISILESVKKEI